MKETFIKKFTNDEGLMIWNMALPYNFFDMKNIEKVTGFEDKNITCRELIIKFIEKNYNISKDKFNIDEWFFDFAHFCIKVKFSIKKGYEGDFLKLNPKWVN